MLSIDKINKLKEIDTDSSDLILKMNEYLKHKYEYNEIENVFESFEELANIGVFKNEDNKYISFSCNDLIIANLKVINIPKIIKDESIDGYYAGKKYMDKVNFYRKSAENFIENYLLDSDNITILIDISSISSFPLWNTMMRRKMNSIINEISNIDISSKILDGTIKKTKLEKIEFDNKYDIDQIIEFMKIFVSKINVRVYIIDSLKTNESIFLTNEINKFLHALFLSNEERNEYIYDTVCKDMDEMFSIYGFCNFKNNMCISQRHKSLFNRYPVPKTDGCCFKLVRKCEHNNKDGTCKVSCLPCKLFTCPFLSKINIGFKLSELILIRSFFNNKQKKSTIYNFYTSKETLLKRINSENNP